MTIICYKMARPLILFAAISVTILAASTSAAVLSIDYGSEWFKVAAVNPRPGQAPISIVLNEFSKRKTQPLVSFSNGERLLGEEAAGIAGRYPDRVYARLRDILGKPYSVVADLLKAAYLPYNITEDAGRGVALVTTHDGKHVFAPEELVAMVLSYMKELGDSHIKSTMRDAVVSVPSYFGHTERQALLTAAQIAGVNVMALINEHAAAALQYGIDKDFTNASRNVILYDMGANSLNVAVVYYSSYSAKVAGKNTTHNQFQILAVRWDPDLGGQTMESRLLEHFVDEFNKKMGKGTDIRTSPKAIAKLRKEVKRTKEILSANTEAPINVEALFDDIDFRSSIKRTKFEELCADLWVRALTPLKAALADANLTTKDIDAFEVIGGATRVPKLQAVLSEFLGEKTLDRHLDADEAIALGGSLLAANLSDGFKLNRKLGMVDVTMYGYVMDLEGISDEIEKPDSTLFQKLRKLPGKVFRVFKGQQTDFKVSVKYAEGGALPPGISSLEVAAYEITGLANATAKHGSRNLTSPIKTTLHFSLSRSGTVSLDRAEAVVEFSEWIDVPIIVPNLITLTNLTANATENTTTTANVTIEAEPGKGEEKSAEGAEEGSEGAEKGGEESGSESDSDTEDASKDAKTAGTKEAAAPVATEKKLRKRTIRVSLKVKDATEGPAKALPKEDVQLALKRLAELKAKDVQKRETAAAKNALEAYIYDTREKLESLDNVDKVSTEGQRDALRGELTDSEDWLYEDGEHATASDFKKRLGDMKKTGDLIFFRVTELESRPAAAEEARKWAAETTSVLKLFPQTRPWINESFVSEVQGKVDEMVKWLGEKEAQQAKKDLHEEPVLGSAEIRRKLVSVQDRLAKLSRIPKPRPKPAPKEKPTTTANNTANGTESSGKTTTEGAKEGGAEKGGEEPKVETKAEDSKAGKDEL